MSGTNVLIWLAVIWVAFAVLGGLLHIVKLLLWIALLATALVMLAGAMRSRPR